MNHIDKKNMNQLKSNILSYSGNLLDSFSTLLFIKSKWVGMVLLLVTLLNVNIAVLGIFSWIVSVAFAKFLGISKENEVHSIYTYNSLLVGFSIGFMFKITYLSILLTFGASILTFLLTFTLFSIFSYYLRLPVLNIPFTIISMTIYLASAKYSSLYVESFYTQERFNFDVLPLFLQGLFKTTGLLLFMPYDLIGIVVLLSILFFSRITFFLTVTSYYFGVLILALFKGSFYEAFTEISSFNFILIGIALGSIFLIPSKKSYLISFIGVLISVLVVDAVTVFWSIYKIPVFTLPFNLVVLLFVYVLTQINYPLLNRLIKESPEKSLTNFINNIKRFQKLLPEPLAPFFGEWTVYQGFDDKWTHKGLWKHALDFVINDDNGKSHSGSGAVCSDYYCFGKPILAPISGRVIEFYDLLPDNAIGLVDKKNNWGNYIIIQSDFGYFVELSHLQYKSVKVGTGDIVKYGTILGNCGNSGYSPEPHIHMQVQSTAKLGDVTLDFILNDIKGINGDLLSGKELKKDTKIIPIQYSKKLNKIFQLILDDKFNYDFLLNGKSIRKIEVIVKMDIYGSYFLSLVGTKDKLYFGLEENKFILYNFEGKKSSLLAKIFIAMPSIPLAENEVKWNEYLPDYLFPYKWGFIFLKSFFPKLNNHYGSYTTANKNKITGKINKYGKQPFIETEIILDDFKGFKYMSYKAKNGKLLELVLLNESNA